MEFDRIRYRHDEILNTFFKDKVVLDIASYDGSSSITLAELGAKKVIGIEPRTESIELAKENLKKSGYSNIEFVCGDATDYDLMDKLLTGVDSVACFGVFYHLTDHFKFLKKICSSSCQYLLIETLFGLESPNPTMVCAVEPTTGNDNQNGINEGYSHVMFGVPNIVWLQQVFDIFNWQIAYFITDNLGDERMIVGAVNKKFINVDASKVMPDDMWVWEIADGETIGKKKFSIF